MVRQYDETGGGIDKPTGNLSRSAVIQAARLKYRFYIHAALVFRCGAAASSQQQYR